MKIQTHEGTEEVSILGKSHVLPKAQARLLRLILQREAEQPLVIDRDDLRRLANVLFPIRAKNQCMSCYDEAA